MKIWIASIAAVAIQPIVFAGYTLPGFFASPQSFYGIRFLLLSVLVVAAAAVLLLGIPAFFLLRKFKKDSWGSLAATGAILGALPVSLSWPRRLEGLSAGRNWHSNYVDTYINGDPTKFAWLTYGENVLYYGLHGLVGALVFYAVWRRTERPNQAPQPTPKSSAAEL